MTTREAILRTARGELGVSESPPGSNRTKYGRAYGLDGVPWCAMFCWWVYMQNGQDLRALNRAGKFQYCPDIVRDLQRAGKWRAARDARPGDLVLFDWRADGIADHIGLVEANTGSALVCIEGNTSNSNWSNGGQVLRMTRGYAFVQGIGAMDLTDALAPTPPLTPSTPGPASPPDEEDVMVLIRAKGRPEVYLTNFLTRSWVPSPKHLDALRFILAAGGKDSGIKELDADLVDGIPLNMSTADYLRYADGIAKAAAKATAAQLPKCR